MNIINNQDFDNQNGKKLIDKSLLLGTEIKSIKNYFSKIQICLFSLNVIIV